jgi:hydroxymethylbilane synthase
MLPIALHTQSRRALLAGGGIVALRKAESLRAAGLHLSVVAPRVDSRIAALLGPDCVISERTYRSSDIEGVALVVAATNDPDVNARIVADARASRILVCDALAPERGDFTMQATVRVGDLTFTFDSGGSTPAFSKRVARELQERFDVRYDAAARTLARMRTYVQTVLEDQPQRAVVLREVAEMPVEELAAMNPVEAEHVVEAVITRLSSTGETARTGTVVCASRASALAMTQTRMIAARLAEAGLATTILTITTTGDRVQDRPVAAIGSVNVFVKELEVALRERRADYAVHSCKDLPGLLEPDMKIAAISQREDPRDAFCSERYESFESLPSGAIVGTSSLRRRTQLEALRPDLRYEDIRGNVDTRLRKLREGAYDAIVLAMAGLNRLRVAAKHTVAFPVERMVPAVAQGALAIETRADETILADTLRSVINDPETELCVTCERAALRSLRAGCSAPLGVHAYFVGGLLRVHAAFALTGSNEIIRETLEAPVTTPAEAESLGERVAAMLAPHVFPEKAHLPLLVLARSQERPSRIAAELRLRGIDVVELPGDDFKTTVMRAPDMVAFPSSGSVDAAIPYLQALRALERRPLVAAMGPQSGAAAHNAGFSPDFVAPEASIEAFVTLIAEHLGH